jgi:hypothetical protein
MGFSNDTVCGYSRSITTFVDARVCLSRPGSIYLILTEVALAADGPGGTRRFFVAPAAKFFSSRCAL